MATLLEKVSEAEKKGCQSIATLYQKTVDQNQLLVNYYQKVTEAIMTGSEQEFNHWNNTDRSGQWKIDRSLNNTVTSLEKAIVAASNSNPQLVTLYEKIAEQNQLAAECYRKAAEAGIATIQIASQKKLSKGYLGLRRGFLNKESKQLQQAERLTKTLESEQAIIRWKKAGDVLQDSIHRLDAAASSLEKAFKMEQSGHQLLAALWRQSAEQYQRLAEFHRKTAEARSLVNNQQSPYSDRADNSTRGSCNHLSDADKSLEEASQAAAQDNQPFYELWRKVAQQDQMAAEYYRKEAEACLLENEQECTRWSNAALSARFSVDALRDAARSFQKAFAAEKDGKKLLSNLWKKAAEQYQEAAENYHKSAEAYEQGNQAEGNRLGGGTWRNEQGIGYTFRKAADALEKQANILSIREGNLNLSLISSPSFSSSGYGSGEASFATLSVPSKIEAKNTFTEALEDIMPTETSIVPYSNSSSGSVTKAGADDCQSDLAAQALEKASKAIAANQKEIAEFWSKSAYLYQELAEYDRQAKKAVTSDHPTKLASFGVFELFDPFEKAANSSKYSYQQLDFAAKALEQASEATDKNQREIAALCCKAAEQHQEAAEYYCQAAKILVRDIEDIKDAAKRQRFHFFEKAAISARNSAAQLDSAVQALEKVIEATVVNKKEIAALWCKKAEQHQKSAAYHRQAMKAMISNNATEHDRFYDLKEAGEFSACAISKLGAVVRALNKAIIARTEGNTTEAIVWEKVVMHYQEAADYLQRAAEACKNGNKSDVEDFKEAARTAEVRAYALKKYEDYL